MQACWPNPKNLGSPVPPAASALPFSTAKLTETPAYAAVLSAVRSPGAPSVPSRPVGSTRAIGSPGASSVHSRSPRAIGSPCASSIRPCPARPPKPSIARSPVLSFETQETLSPHPSAGRTASGSFDFLRFGDSYRWMGKEIGRPRRGATIICTGLTRISSGSGSSTWFGRLPPG